MDDFKEAMVQYRAAKKGLNGIQKLPSLAGYEGQQRKMMEEHYTSIDKNNDMLKGTYNNAKRAVLNLVDYSIDDENGFILINGIPFEKGYDNNKNVYVKNHFTDEWILLEEGIIELADELVNKKEENITTIKTQLLNKYEKKQTNIKLQKEERKLKEEEEKRKKKFIGNTITPKTQEITQKTEELNKSINIRALYGLFLKLLKNILLPKKIGSYKKGSIFVGLTNHEYNINGQIDRLLEYIQRDDAYWASDYFLTLISNIEKNPSFKALYDVLMKDDVLEFLFQTLRNMEKEQSKLSVAHYKSILKVLKIVVEDSTSLKPDIKKTIIADIDTLSNFEDLNSKEANLDKSTSNLVRLENKMAKKNYTPLVNHSNVAVQNLTLRKKDTVTAINTKTNGPLSTHSNTSNYETFLKEQGFTKNDKIKAYAEYLKTLEKDNPDKYSKELSDYNKFLKRKTAAQPALIAETLGKATPGTTLVPKVVPKQKSWFGFGGRVSKKRTRKQSKQSKRSKRVQTRRR